MKIIWQAKSDTLKYSGYLNTRCKIFKTQFLEHDPCPSDQKRITLYKYSHAAVVQRIYKEVQCADTVAFKGFALWLVAADGADDDTTYPDGRTCRQRATNVKIEARESALS